MTFGRAEEFSDLRTYDAPDVLRYVMGFGDELEKALSGPLQKLLDGGFIQAVKMVVDNVGFDPAWTFGPAGERTRSRSAVTRVHGDRQGFPTRKRGSGAEEQPRHRRHRGALGELGAGGVCG